MRTTLFRHSVCALALPVGLLLSAPDVLAQKRDAQTVMSQTCVACHSAEKSGGKLRFSRISDQRKTPEGWLMTIARMQTMHGLSISDEDRRTVVKYLSDTQGLAPSETAEVRYGLERRMNTIEQVRSEQFQQMCARCHSAARPLLQRRTLSEWTSLVHFHLGQYPSVEYSALGRDREWLDIALKEVVPKLAADYPYDSKEWDEWQKKQPKAATLAGRWSFSGHMPGKGSVHGVMTATSAGNDSLKLAVKGRYADGSPFDGSGTALLYAGHEWRASVKVNGVPMRQVLSAKDGELRGRMFEARHDERGLDFHAAKAGTARILSVQPAYLRQGTEAEIAIVGAKLDGKPDLGAGIEVLQVLSRSPELVRVRARARATAEPGLRQAAVGKTKGGSLAVYRSIDAVKVVPAYAVARIGGNGGPTAKVEGRFDAEAWSKDGRGKPFRIGIVPAQWSVAPFDERAVEDEDLKFAGTMDSASGVFTPGDAGPNPARKMSANNVGNLKVLALVKEGSETVKGEGRLIVAAQRWNNPPIP